MNDEGATTSVVRRWHIAGFVLLTAMGVYSVGVALTLGLWRQNSPGEGLFPFISAVAMTAFAFLALLSARRLPKGPTVAIADLQGKLERVGIYLLVLVFYAAALDPLGFIVSTIAAVILILRFAERYSWPVACALVLGTVVVCQLLFVVWLGANLPSGYLWDNVIN